MDRRPSRNLDEEGQALVERLGGHWTAAGGMCRCPAHDDRTPSLSVRAGRTRLLLHCFAGCEPAAVLAAVRRDGLLAMTPPRAGEPTVGAKAEHGRRMLDAAHAIWTGARSIAGTPAAAYLESRGVAAMSPDLRYHCRAPLGPSPQTEFRPALIAAVRDDSGLVAVHRTFVGPRGEGLADVPSPRCGLGRFGRGAVRLGGSGPTLGLAEGIETALSVTALFGVRCWATLGTERFALVAIPHGVRELLLFLDHDAGGRRAERLARDSFAAVPSIVARYPRRPGDDWNDVLRRSRPRARSPADGALDAVRASGGGAPQCVILGTETTIC